MKAYKEFFIVFAIGASVYPVLEIIWRGYTHWTMSVTGGICFLSIYILFTKSRDFPVWIKCVLGAGVITVIEFVAGCIVNLILGWGVWDYSGSPVNFLGQICLFHTALWAFLCLPAVYISNFISFRLRNKAGAAKTTAAVLTNMRQERL